jgi:hypothetical protein
VKVLQPVAQVVETIAAPTQLAREQGCPGVAEPDAAVPCPIAGGRRVEQLEVGMGDEGLGMPCIADCEGQGNVGCKIWYD